VNQDERNQKNRGELWVDYLENDLEAPLKKDLDLILANSDFDKKNLRDLKITKSLIKASVPVGEREDAFFDKLHGNIMTNLDRKTDDGVVIFPRSSWIPVAAAIALVVIGGLVLSQLRKSGQVPRHLRGDILISESALNLDAFSDSLINDQSEGDFFIEVAAQKMDSLTQAETANFFDHLRE
jgi:hypothetical protein